MAFNLLGSVPYIMSDPAAEGRENMRLGAQMSQNMVENLERRRSFERDDQRWNEQAPLRDAQRAGILLNNRKAQIDIENSVNAQALDTMWRSKQGEAMQVEAVISEKGFTPESKVEFYRFIEKNPRLGDTQWAWNMRKQFDIAETARREAENAEQNRLSAETRAAIAARSREDVADIRNTPTGANNPDLEQAVDTKTGQPIPNVYIQRSTGRVVQLRGNGLLDFFMNDDGSSPTSPNIVPETSGTTQQAPSRIRFDSKGNRIN